MKELLNNLMHSELLKVELIALAFILLVLILGLVFGYNIRKFPYPSFLILVFFPLIWFGIKWISGLIGGITFSETNKWVLISVVSIVVIILIVRYWPEKWKSSGSPSRLVSFDKGGRVVAPTTKEKPWWILFFLSGMVMVIALCLITMMAKGWKLYDVDNPPVGVTTNSKPPAYYEQVTLGQPNHFSAGIPKSFQIRSGTSYHTIPQKINDTIMLTWSGPSGSWSYLVWKDKPGGMPIYHIIKPQPNEFDGQHTVVADKDCAITWKAVLKE